MKKLLLLTTLVALGLSPALAQFGAGGGGPQGPNLDTALMKLFGDRQAFSGQMEFQMVDESTNTLAIPGKISFDHGKTRFEINLLEVQSTNLPPGAGEVMKSMGMDVMVAISRPDKKLSYLVYPGLQSYAEVPLAEKAGGANLSDYKLQTKELGKENFDGHPCVKNQTTVTGKDAVKHECTVWNATDLENFPIKIVTAEKEQPVTISFKKLSFKAPAVGDFEPPAGLTKYTNMQTLMQTEMMKKMGGDLGAPPGQK